VTVPLSTSYDEELAAGDIAHVDSLPDRGSSTRNTETDPSSNLPTMSELNEVSRAIQKVR
jgi:hypothetical protein